MTSHDTRAYMAMMAIAQHHGRPRTPTDQAWIESFFTTSPTNGPTSTRSPTRRCSTQSWHASGSTTTRSGCTEAIGYVTPDDEHHQRGEPIREARRQGLQRARTRRLDHNRRTTTNNPEAQHDLVHFSADRRGRLRHTSPAGSLAGIDSRNIPPAGSLRISVRFMTSTVNTRCYIKTSDSHDVGVSSRARAWLSV